MKFISVAKKAFNYLERLKLQKYAINTNMYYVGKKIDFLKPRNILFYFPDYEFMHFGDHLFFEPLADFLRESGLKVKILPTKEMEFYFKDNGFQIATGSDLAAFDLIISRPEFYAGLKDKGLNVLYIDTASHRIKEYLCQDMVNKTAEFLGLNTNVFIARPAPLQHYPHRIELEQNTNYLLFNNYIDSGFHRVGRRQYEKITRFAKQKAKELGLQVIHVGTQRDKDRDRRQYDFVALDLRGKTSPANLFYLASLENVKCNVSFDAFLMHIFAIYTKKSFVLFRGRFFRSASEYLINYVNPPFNPNQPKSELIEYI